MNIQYDRIYPISYFYQLVFLAVIGLISNGFGQALWTPQNSGTTTNTLYGITWGGNQFVAVGNSGTILTSPDGISWTSRIINTITTFQYVAFGANVFVAAGGNSILTSSDGIAWTVRNQNSSIYGITWNNNQFVAVGGGGTILTSTNGISWTQQTSGTINTLYAVTWGNNEYVAVGVYGTILTSPNGINWTVRSSFTQNALKGIAYGNNRFYTTGWIDTIYSSADGISWNQKAKITANGATDMEAIIYRNNIFIAIGYDIIQTSSDGSLWAKSPCDSISFYGIAYGNNKFVAVGWPGKIYTLSSVAPITYQAHANNHMNQIVSVSNNTITYMLNTAAKVTMQLFDTKGRIVKTILNQRREYGVHKLSIPSTVLQGNYILSFNIEGYKSCQPITIIR